MTASQQEIVRAILAEMRAKLAQRTDDNARDVDAGMICLSNVLATFTREESLPPLVVASDQGLQVREPQAFRGNCDGLWAESRAGGALARV